MPRTASHSRIRAPFDKKTEGRPDAVAFLYFLAIFQFYIVYLYFICILIMNILGVLFIGNEDISALYV